MAKRKREGHSLPSWPKDPTGELYSKAAAFCVAVAREMPIDGIPIDQLVKEVYKSCFRIAREVGERSGSYELLEELQHSGWCNAIGGTLGHRLGLNGLGYLQRVPDARAQRREYRKQIRQMRRYFASSFNGPNPQASMSFGEWLLKYFGGGQ